MVGENKDLGGIGNIWRGTKGDRRGVALELPASRAGVGWAEPTALTCFPLTEVLTARGC